MPNTEKLYIKPNRKLPQALMDKIVSHESNTLEAVIQRVEAGLVGELLIDDNINFPYIAKGDIVVLKDSTNIRLKDFILYKYKDKYYLRRVLKINGHEIYVAGDNEREYHVTTRADIVAKGISRIRGNKYKSFNLKKKDRLYLFTKYNLQKLRIGSRIIRPENEDVAEAMTQAIKANLTRNIFVNKTIESKINDELDNELSNFIDPDTLVLELQAALKEQNEETYDATVEDVVEATEEASAEKSEDEANNTERQNQDEEVEEIIQYVLEDGTIVDKDGNKLEQESSESEESENASEPIDTENSESEENTIEAYDEN